jgi:uracil-DNA glycosylase
MWTTIIENEKQKPYFKELEKFLEEEYARKEIFPKKAEIYQAFDLTPFDKVKVVIIGQDPYHDENQAHGLAFSVQKGIKVPPSLRNIYKELASDITFQVPNHGYLYSWAIEGVLLLNTILTVEAHKPLSHKKKGWEIFTDHILQELNKDDNPKIFVLWGNNAIKKEIYLTNSKHYIIKTSHPSPLSARHSFFGSKQFSEINNVLEKWGKDPINWQIKNDE